MLEIIFRRNNSFFGYVQGIGHLFRWGKWGNYQHVELRFDRLDSLTGNRVCWSSSVLDGGVRFTGAISGNPKKWVRYQARVGRNPLKSRVMMASTWIRQRQAWIRQREKQLLKYCRTLVGRLYDKTGIGAFVMPHIIKQNKERFFCSEAVVTALQKSLRQLNTLPTQISPSQLARRLDKLGYKIIKDVSA